MTAPTSPARFSFARLLMLLVPALILGGGAAWYWYQTQVKPVESVDYALYLMRGLKVPTSLDDAFTDSDGDLVADLPADKSKWLDPKKLMFASLGPILESELLEWKDFMAHLEKVTGRKVEMAPPTEAGIECMEAMRSGELHVMGLSTGAVPIAVNTAGFVPAFVMAGADGKFGYQAEILVPAGSSVKSPAELRGRKVRLGRGSSLSSFRVPVAVLWGEHGLLPGRDFEYSQGLPQADLMKEVTDGRADAVAVANDYLSRVVERGDVEGAKFRSIYKSPSFPPACFGYAHKLHPDLAAKVKESFTSFSWEGTALAKAYAPAQQSRFVPVTYKEDWQAVRTLDASVAKLIEAKGK